MSAINSNTRVEDLPKDIWMVRPCEIYREEYNDCSGFKGRFQQYYVFGENQDCQKWKEDYKNCLKFRKTQSLEALRQIVKNETERRKTRLENARKNDIWEYRSTPPKDWTRPLGSRTDT